MPVHANPIFLARAIYLLLLPFFLLWRGSKVLQRNCGGSHDCNALPYGIVATTFFTATKNHMLSKQEQEEEKKRKLREFLLEQDVDSIGVDKALLVLWGNEVYNVATLTAFSSEDKLRDLTARNDKGEEVRLGAGTIAVLWKYIVEQKRGEALLGPESALHEPKKRLRREDENLSGFSHFLYKVAEYSQRGVPKWGSTMDFAEDWFDKRETPARSLYIRKCYEDMFGEYEPLTSPGSHKGSAGVAVIGTPGIGKSGFGIYSVARFASTRPVYYKHKASAARLIVACEQAVKSVQSVFPDVVTTGIYEIPLELTLEQFKSIPGVVAVIDPLLNDLVLPARMFQIIVSSPDDNKLKEFLKSSLTIRRVMPKWTLEEIRAIVPLHISNEQRMDSAALAKVQDQAEVDFEFFGGVPRSIFDARKSRTKVREQIAGAKAESLRRAVESGDSVRGDLGAYIVHSVPDPDDPDGVKWEPASRSIGKLLVATMIKRSKDELKVFFASTSRIPAVQQIRGLALEAAAHDLLAQGGDFKIADLPSGDASSSVLNFRSISLPPLEHVSFERKDMLDLTELSENQLAIPMVGNFESVDAFAVLRQGLLTGVKNPESTPLSCIGFQTTVADTHGTKGAGLKRVRDKVEDLVGTKRTLLSLVFISESTGISKRQRIVTAAGEEYGDGFDQAVSQHVIQLGTKFDELVVKMYA